VQLLRSISEWAGGVFVETSIAQALTDLVLGAQHYIYIGMCVALHAHRFWFYFLLIYTYVTSYIYKGRGIARA
jgi:hypothetical protein